MACARVLDRIFEGFVVSYKTFSTYIWYLGPAAATTRAGFYSIVCSTCSGINQEL